MGSHNWHYFFLMLFVFLEIFLLRKAQAAADFSVGACPLTD